MSYTYENSTTLKNLKNLTDPEELDNYSYNVSIIATVKILKEPTPERFDIQYLKEIHEKLFAKVFEWAGHTRDEAFHLSDGTIASQPVLAKTDGADFAYGKDFSKYFERFDQDMLVSNTLKNLNREEFSIKVAEKFAEINKIHPFRDGNGRTQRIFFERLGQAAGHILDFDVVTADRMTAISIAAHENRNLQPMKHMFEDISNMEKVQALRNFDKNFPFLSQMNVSFAQDNQAYIQKLLQIVFRESL